MSAERWQFRFTDSEHGALFAGARRRQRGDWREAKDLPEYVRQFLALDQQNGAWFYRGATSTAEMKQQIDEAETEVTWHPKTGPGLTGSVWINPPETKPKRTISPKVPAIRNLKQLCEHFSAENPGLLNKRIYKRTDCGASVSVRTKDGKWHHNAEWSRIEEIDAFTIQATVEGTNSKTFILPVTVKEVEDWIADMEAQADGL